MGDRIFIGIMGNRLVRHLLFWVVWVFSFTFIKSFGAAIDVYLAWFVYYLLSLPLFVGHTYLLVYWMVPNFLKGPKIALFIVFFLVLFFLFSFLELYLSVEVLAKWNQDVFDGTESYNDLATLLINGVGNLYIILVFVASKMVRSWYLSEGEKKTLEQKELILERADVNAGIQPEMLLYLTNSIRHLASRDAVDVPASIAILSELMNDVMQANEVQLHRVDEEVRMVKKMLKIYSVLNEGREVKLLVSGNELHRIKIAAFMLLSPLDIIIRKYDYMSIECFALEIEEQRNGNMLLFSIKFEAGRDEVFSIDPIQELLNSYYPGKYIVDSLSDSVTFRIKEVVKED